MKTKGEIESEIEAGMKEVFVSLFGKGPISCRVSLVQKHAFLIVQNVFSVCERKLLESGHGQKIYKEMREALLDSNLEKMKYMVETASGVEARSMLHDISTSSGEESFVFSLSRMPEFALKKCAMKSA